MYHLRNVTAISEVVLKQLLIFLPFRILTRLLEKSTDPTILAVAAHDTGEYVRHYPRGKQ